MNKMNKKGFTLIEMLVVIAIIAVLVSIIIPTVTSATDKAAAAANAANLRSVKAEIVTAYLTNDQTNYSFSNGSVTAIEGKNASAPAWKTVTADFISNCGIKAKDDNSTGFKATYTDGGVIKVYYDGYSIDTWATMAGGKPAATTAGSGNNGG